MKKKKKIDSVTVHSFSRGTDLFFNIIVGIFALSCLLPLFFVIVISLTDENALATYGYRLWPKVWSFAGYKYLATMGGELLRSLWISVLVTVVGTVINSTFTSTYAYAISRSSFKYRRFFTVFCLVQCYFHLVWLLIILL